MIKIEEYKLIEIIILSCVAGLIGSIFMDITESYMSQKGINSGVTVNHIGRWFVLMLKGVLKHQDIETTKVVSYEVTAGKFFHYIIAGCGITILYPLFLYLFGIGMEAPHMLYGVIFGFLTNAFPWFWMMPSFGWGLCGIKKPTASNTIIAPTISHIAYGLGVGIVFELFY